MTATLSILGHNLAVVPNTFQANEQVYVVVQNIGLRTIVVNCKQDIARVFFIKIDI